MLIDFDSSIPLALLTLMDQGLLGKSLSMSLKRAISIAFDSSTPLTLRPDRKASQLKVTQAVNTTCQSLKIALSPRCMEGVPNNRLPAELFVFLLFAQTTVKCGGGRGVGDATRRVADIASAHRAYCARPCRNWIYCIGLLGSKLMSERLPRSVDGQV